MYIYIYIYIYTYIYIFSSRIFVLHKMDQRQDHWGKSNFSMGKVAVVANVVKVVAYWESLCKIANSYDLLVSAYQDKLTIAKLTFFKNVAVILKSCLVVFQTDNPLILFLSDVLDGMIQKIINIFIKKEVLTEANMICKLIKIDVEKVEN